MLTAGKDRQLFPPRFQYAIIVAILTSPLQSAEDELMGFFTVPEYLKEPLRQLLQASPACLIGILVLGAGGYTWSMQTFAKSPELQGFKEVLIARLAVTDTQAIVREVQAQIRTKEREISDLEMVVSGMNAPTAARQTLSDRVFTLKQDLDDLKTKLAQALTDQQNARQDFAKASAK